MSDKVKKWISFAAMCAFLWFAFGTVWRLQSIQYPTFWDIFVPVCAIIFSVAGAICFTIFSEKEKHPKNPLDNEINIVAQEMLKARKKNH